MKNKLYKIIKEGHEVTADDISRMLNISKDEVLKILKAEIKKGFIEIANGKYHVRHFLMPPVLKPAEGIAWDFGKIQEEEILPDEVMSALNNKIAPRQQGDRGTCVGQSSSAMMDYLHMILTKEDPTGSIIRDISDMTPAIRDQLYDQTFSAESIYQWSRKEGNVTAPAGSYCSAAIKALNKKGICLEKQWYTSKSSRGAWAEPFPSSVSECETEGAKHKLEGYAVIRTVYDLKRCLAKYGVALGAINIYENYMDGGLVREDGADVIDGNLPEIRGGLAGSHALVFIGYSESKRRVYFRHSWQGWTKIGSISYAYWETAGGDFWAPLDTADTIIGKKLYQTIEFIVQPTEASTRAILTINDVRRTEILPAKIALEKGLPATITVAAAGYKAQGRTIQSVDESINQITFILEAESKLVIVPLWQAILEWIVKLFKR